MAGTDDAEMTVVEGDDARLSQSLRKGHHAGVCEQGERTVTAHRELVGENGGVEIDREEIIEELRRHGAVFALVFGSRARGDEHHGSDLDIAAWWPADPPAPWSVPLPVGVDLVVLNEAPLELAGRIALEGRILFSDDRVAEVRWTATTRKIWLDERPRYEQAHRIYFEAVARGR